MWQALFIAAGYIQLPLAAVKISILFFYKRIFSVRSFRIAAWLLIILCGVWGIVFFLVGFDLSLVKKGKTYACLRSFGSSVIHIILAGTHQ